MLSLDSSTEKGTILIVLNCALVFGPFFRHNRNLFVDGLLYEFGYCYE